MKIVGVHLEPGPVGWHRCWNWTTGLQRLGHTVTHRVHQGTQFDWGETDEFFRGADVVITSKMANPQVFATLLAYRDMYGFKLVVDTDDAYDITPKYNQSFVDYHPGTSVRRLIDAEMRHADLITVSTPTLADRFRKFNKRVAVIPNVVDPRLHINVRSRKKEARHADDLRIYWGGGGGHYDDLLVVKNAVLRTFRERPNVKLVFSNFIPDWAADLPPFRVFMIRFAHFNAYPKVLRWLCADVALAPLTSNDFNRCKSHVKYLDYAMARIPGVYQDMEPYASVTNGITGMKASTRDEWYAAINTLLDDPALRKNISVHAYGDVMTRWTTDGWIAKYETMLKELVAIKTPVMSMLSEGRPLEAQCLTS